MNFAPNLYLLLLRNLPMCPTTFFCIPKMKGDVVYCQERCPKLCSLQISLQLATNNRYGIYKHFGMLRQILFKFSKMSRIEYCKVLGVTPGTSQQEIKARFHKLAKEFHPDAGNPNNEQKFKQILEAYKFLSDQKNRYVEGQSTTAKQSYGQNPIHEQHQSSEENYRRQTYDFLNRKPRPRSDYQEEQFDKVPSLMETLKAAPQLCFITAFMVILIVSQFFGSPRGRTGHYSYPQKLQMSQEQRTEDFYLQRQTQRQELQANSRRFNYQKRYNRPN